LTAKFPVSAIKSWK